MVDVTLHPGAVLVPPALLILLSSEGELVSFLGDVSLLELTSSEMQAVTGQAAWIHPSSLPVSYGGKGASRKGRMNLSRQQVVEDFPSSGGCAHMGGLNSPRISRGALTGLTSP